MSSDHNVGRQRVRNRSQTSTKSANNERKHPSHLKGKEIGLYYAKLNKQKRKEPMKPIPTVTISRRIDKKLNRMISKANCKQQDVEFDGKNYNHVQDSAFKRDFMKTISESIGDKLAKETFAIVKNEKIDMELRNEFEAKMNNSKYQQMLKFREKLPSYKMQSELLDLIENNQIVVISGETGCGKTTQVAQFILDDYLKKGRGSLCRIICTQPRRISAISVAERVAEERAEKLGKSVGFQIRLEQVAPRDCASIRFCTTGIVLKQMENDPSLSNCSHLILDEIHERDVLSDFILAIIKRVLQQRKDLKVILMSATLNSEKFSTYYNNAPQINIPGFTYPVQEYYLEDVLEKTRFEFKLTKTKFDLAFSDIIDPHIRLLQSEGKYSKQVLKQLRNPQSEEINVELIMALISYICENETDGGAILIFLTGYSEISALSQLMEKSGNFPRHKYRIIPLHSLMPSIEQRQVFATPPLGVRKIVIATNIAETSITIDDVVFVIDCGKIKLSNFDTKTNTQTLKPEWVSLANAKQRRGRAGRVKPGVCYHLYSRAREMVLDQFQLPEILRKRLEDVILIAKVLQLGKVEDFFASLLDSPDSEAVILSLDLLQRLNALDDDENLTPLGYHLAKLPMAPQMGKMILYGAIFSCLDPILSIAATLDYKDAFQMPIGMNTQINRKKLELANGLKSDHLLFHQVLNEFEQVSQPSKFCWDYFLNQQTCKLLINMKNQFMKYLYDMNFVPNSNPKSKDVNRNSNNLCLVKAVIAAGLYPNVLISKYQGKKPLNTPDNEQTFKFHPKSILAEERYFHTQLLVYYIKVKTQREYIHDATLINPLAIVFFGEDFTIEEDNSIIVINKLLKFKTNQLALTVLIELRKRFNKFLEWKISHPGPISWEKIEHHTVILDLMKRLITCEDRGDLECYELEDNNENNDQSDSY